MYAFGICILRSYVVAALVRIVWISTVTHSIIPQWYRNRNSYEFSLVNIVAPPFTPSCTQINYPVVILEYRDRFLLIIILSSIDQFCRSGWPPLSCEPDPAPPCTRPCGHNRRDSNAASDIPCCNSRMPCSLGNTCAYRPRERRHNRRTNR